VMYRDVVHLNVSNFMASVEQVCDPCLRDRPLVIAPEGRARAVVLDLSERAFREGIRRGMPLRMVRSRIRETIVVPPRPDLYARAESAMYNMACEYSPLVEQAGRGNIFVDISGTGRLFGEPVDVAAGIRRELKQRLRFESSTGLATNKLVSKVATRVVKPYGFASVAAGDEGGFLGPQDISMLPGIGRRLLERMRLLAIESIGQFAALDDDEAFLAFGRKGVSLRDRARGIDTSPVTGIGDVEPAIRSERVLDTDTNDIDEVACCLRSVVEDAGFRLREQGMAAGSLELHVRYTDSFERIRRRSLKQPVILDLDLMSCARELLEKAMDRRVRVRGLNLKLKKLRPGCFQMDLFDPDNRKNERSLQEALDGIRRRFGRQSIGISRVQLNPGPSKVEFSSICPRSRGRPPCLPFDYGSVGTPGYRLAGSGPP